MLSYGLGMFTYFLTYNLLITEFSDIHSEQLLGISKHKHEMYFGAGLSKKKKNRRGIASPHRPRLNHPPFCVLSEEKEQWIRWEPSEGISLLRNLQ